MQDTGLETEKIKSGKPKTHLKADEKRLAIQLAQVGFSKLRIAQAINRDWRTVSKFFARVKIRPNVTGTMRQEVVEMMDMLDPLAVIVHGKHLVSDNDDLSSKHSLAHLKGKQYLAEQTISTIQTASEDQLDKSLTDAMVLALKASSTDAVLVAPDSVDVIAQSKEHVSIAQTVPKQRKKYKVSRAQRRLNEARQRPKVYTSQGVRANAIKRKAITNQNDLRGDPASVTGKG